MLNKIKDKKNWQVTKNYRIAIVNSTYRQALFYINTLRLSGVKDIRTKPIIES